MIAVKCPFWARWHPTVSSVLMCARFFKRKHTLVFTGNANNSTIGNAVPYHSLAEVSDLVTLSEGTVYNASLIGPSATTLACFFASSLNIENNGKYTSREVDDFIEKLFASDALARKVLRDVDSLVLAIHAENPKLVSYSHAAFCNTVKYLDSSLLELVKDNAKDNASLNRHISEAALIPVKAVMDFVVHDAKMVVGPYKGIDRLVHGNDLTLFSLASSVSNLILQSTIEYTNNDISSIYPTTHANSGSFPHRQVLASVHAFLREYNSTNVLDRGESDSSKHGRYTAGTMGSQASLSTKPYMGTKKMPPVRD